MSKNSPVTNPAISTAYRALSTGAKHLEQDFIRETAEAMKSGSLSVSIVRDSIKAEQKATGNAPTIRASHAQWLPLAAHILNNQADAEFLSVGELLKLAEKLGREQGTAKAIAAVEESADLEELAELAPTQTQSVKAKAKASTAKPRSVDAVLGVAIAELKAFKKADLKVADLQTLKVLSDLLKVVAINSTPKAKANA